MATWPSGLPSSEHAAWVRRHEIALSIGLSTLIVLAVQIAHRVGELPHDSGEYWNLASPATIGSFPSHRGYFFSALLLPIRSLVDLSSTPFLVLRLLLALLWGVVLPTLVPAVFHAAFGGRVTLVRRLVPVLLAATIFPGALVYPLSDLPALVLVFGAIGCLMKALPDARAGGFDPAPKRPSRGRAIAWLLTAGFLLGGAYNTRTIYVFAFVGVLLWILAPRRGTNLTPLRDFSARAVAILVIAAGVALSALPQRIINQRTHGSHKFSPVTQIGSRDLAASQLFWGMTVQRYETSIDPASPSPMVFYLDPAGQRLFDETSGEPDFFTVRGYLKLLAKHPLDFAGIYGRHVANALDVRDGLGYLRKSSPRRNRTAAFNFLVLALAAFTLVACRTRVVGTAAMPTAVRFTRLEPTGLRAARADWKFILATLLLPVAAIVPGAMESRFFMPLHVLAWCVVAFRFDAQRARGFLRRHGIATAATLIASAAIFFAITAATMSNQTHHWPAIYRYGPAPK